MKTCELLVTTNDGVVVAGKIFLDGSKISSSVDDQHYNSLVNSVMEETTFYNEEVIDRSENPVEWFNSLPFCYTGSYLRANISAQQELPS